MMSVGHSEIARVGLVFLMRRKPLRCQANVVTQIPAANSVLLNGNFLRRNVLPLLSSAGVAGASVRFTAAANVVRGGFELRPVNDRLEFSARAGFLPG